MASKRRKKPNGIREGSTDPVRLDLGAGQRKELGWIAVDSVALPTVDVVHDLSQRPWPWDKDSVDEARMIHVLEHFSGYQIMAVLDELYRILKPGGTCFILSPYYSSIRAFQDPTHKFPISEALFLYFNRGWRKSQGLDHYPIEADFDYTFGYGIGQDWASRAEEPRNFAIRHYVNAVNDIHVTLTKRAAA